MSAKTLILQYVNLLTELEMVYNSILLKYLKVLNLHLKYNEIFTFVGTRGVNDQKLSRGRSGRRRRRTRVGGGRTHAHLHPGPALRARGALHVPGAPVLLRAVLPRHAAAEGLHRQGEPRCWWPGHVPYILDRFFYFVERNTNLNSIATTPYSGYEYEWNR